MASSSAPGRLELVREFVNSVEIDSGADPLCGPDGLESWCTEGGRCAGLDAGALTLLREFREALRGALEANLGTADMASAWRALEPFAGRAGFKIRITGPGKPALEPQGSGPDAFVAEVFGIVYDAVADGTWQRLKACRKHTCRWAFYDRSKNGSGAWCNMAVCGNREKAHRRRLSSKNAPGK